MGSANGSGTDATSASRRPRTGRWLWAGVVAAVAVGVALVVVISLTARPGALRTGAAAAAAVGIDAESAPLAELIAGGEALAASTTPGELADPTAYTQLMGALVSARTSLGGATARVDLARQSLVDAIDRVQRSRTAKSLGDAQATLEAVIATAVDVVASTAGRVPDDAVRTELQARIDAGRALLGAAASVDAVLQQVQTITEQTAVVLEARHLGFREADGRWCAAGARACLEVAWPLLVVGGERVEHVELAGGEVAVDGGGCFETDRFVLGRDRVALLYCPAGAAVPDGRRVSGPDAGEVERDRLWISDGARLTELRYRA